MFFLSLLICAGAIAEDSLPDDIAKAPEESTSTPGSADLRILYTGNRMGVSAERYPFPSILRIQAFEEAGKIETANFQRLLIAEWNGQFVIAHNHPLKKVVTMLREEDFECGSGVEITALETTYEVMFMDGENKSQLHRLLETGQSTSKTWYQRQCESTDGTKFLINAPSPLPTQEGTNTIELRKAYRAVSNPDKQEANLLSIGRPFQEFSRTHHKIRAELSQSGNTLYLDAGNFVDGPSSIVPFGTSLHRPLLFSALEELSPSALGFGNTELIGGIEHFKSEISQRNLPYVASNWHSENPDFEFPKYHVIEMNTENGPMKVGVVSVMDPFLHEQIPSLATSGIRIGHPVSDTQVVIDTMMANQNSPDIVVVLSTAGASVQEMLRRKLRGAHLMLGDSTMATLRIQRREISFLAMNATQKAAPLTLAMDGLSVVDVYTDDNQQPRKIINTPLPITAKSPFSDDVRKGITDNRMSYQKEHTVLLTPPGTGSLAIYSQDEWSKIVCEALRVQMNADTVFLRELPSISKLPGPLRQKDVADALATMDVVEVHRIPGNRFLRFLDQSFSVTPISCGAEPGAAYPKARGRFIDPDQMYQVVTTDLTRHSTMLNQIIPAHQKNFPLDQPSNEHFKNETGMPITLRETVIEQLNVLSRDSDEFDTHTYLAEFSPKDVPPIWILRSRGLSLRTESFAGMENDVFLNVPETQATSPTSKTVSYASDVALEFSNSTMFMDLRYQSTFTELTADDVDTEIDDDWKTSTSLALVQKGFTTGELYWMPYSEVLYDSEYTPVEDENGIPNPFKQSDLSIRSGLSTKPWKMVRNVRLAALANRDIAQLIEKPTEYAALAQLETRWIVPGGVVWSINGEYLWYGRTQDDDDSDLRVRASGLSRLSYPFSRLGSVSVYGEGLLIKGRVSETAEWGHAHTVGLSLDMLGAVTLNRL